MNYQVSTERRTPKTHILGYKTGDIHLTAVKAEIVRKWLTENRAQRFLDLTDDKGEYCQTLDKYEVKGGITKIPVYETKSADGIYCEWGTWHIQFPFEDKCTCLKETGVPWWDMVKARKSFYPRNTRPEGCPENALRKKERETLVAYCHEYYEKELPVPNPPKE